MEKLKIGIVGLGTISQRHVDAINKAGTMALTAICHHNESHLAKRAEQWGVEKVYAKYEDMLEKSGIGAVVIATPNNLHAPMTIAALEAGKHVFCEKPPAMNAIEAKQVKECAKKTGKLVMYGFMFRFSKKHALVKELQQKGVFGDIYYAKAGIVRRCGNPGGWFANKAVSGGGPLIDTGAHIVDLATYLMGEPEPVSVFARAFKRTENLGDIKAWDGYQALNAGIVTNDVEEFDLVVVNYDNGACLVVETSNVSHIKEDSMYLKLQGSKGGATADPELEVYSVIHGYLVDITPRVNCSQFDYQGAIDAEIAHFADCIQNGRECIASIDAGYKLMKIISAAYKSAGEQRLVSINEMD